jgi:Grx4 family monothiol glutaredoxin
LQTIYCRVFAALADATKNDTVYLSVNAETLPDISERYEVSAVPFFVLLKDKNHVEKISGADPQALRSAVEKFSGTSGISLPAPQQTIAPPATTTANGGETSEPDASEEVEEDINVRLGKLVKAAPVMLFMKGTPAAPQCGFSRKMVGLLRERGIRYGFFNILADDEVREGLKTFSNWPTYPQLYVKGDLIGGLDIVSFTSTAGYEKRVFIDDG